MSTFVQKVTSAVAGLAIAFSVVSPIAGVSAAYSSVQAADKLATLDVIVDQSANPADYRLGDNLPRKEATKVMMNLSTDIDVVDNCTGEFSDLTSADWACKYAETALANGMVAANANFRPDDLVSKIEALKMVFQGRGLERNNDADWRMGYVSAAVEMGVAPAAFTDYDAAASRGEMFIWAVNAIDAGEVADPSDLLCEILGTCDPVVVEPTDPVVVTPPVTTGGTAMISLSPQSPSNGLAAVNTPRVAMLTFDVTAGSSDVTLEQVTLYHVGLGDRQNVDNVTVYDSRNASVSKTKNFNQNDLDISFDRDIVVQAGTTETYTIAATLTDNGATNTTYQIELGSLEASAAVSGSGIVGAALTPTNVSNSGLLKVEDDTASDTVEIGDRVTLAGFSIEEKNDNEDVLIRTITLFQIGSVDSEYIEDLVLKADGVEIATGLMVDNDDELVMNIDYVLAADDKVDFELTGVISGDVNETVHFAFEGIDDIYATGMSTGFNIGFDGTNAPGDSSVDVASVETIEGAEIDAVFDRSDVDETKVDVDDVLVGTLELTANSNDYEVTEIQVTVSGTAGTAAIDDMYLDGSSFDSVSGNVYTFEDIVLSQGVTEVLPLEFDVKDDILLNGTNVIFDVQITEIDDDENNITYTLTSTPDIGDIISSNAFDQQSIDIETASFELTQTQVNDREVVLANGIETVLYKAKISVGDSDTISVEDFDLTLNAGSTLSVDLDDVIDSATLNIGGTTFDGDEDSDSIDFTSINYDIAAGTDNVELLVTAVLKDDDSIGVSETLIMELLAANIELEDSDGEDVVGASKVITTGSQNTTTTLREEGTFEIKVINEVDTDDNLENTVLAGESGVVIAELELEAEYEDMDVEELFFTVAGGDFSNTFDDAMIMNGSAVIADGAVITFDGTNTRIRFDDFTVADADDQMDAELVVNLNNITGTGDATSATAGVSTVTVSAADVDVEGADSNNTIVADTTGTVASEAVSVVPTLLVFSVVENLSNGQAKVKVTADSGANTVGTSSETPEVVLNSLTFTDLAGSAGGYIVYKDGEASVQGSLAAGTGAKPVAFGAVDVQFDTSNTYIIVPAATVDETYSLVLSGLVANYDVVDSTSTVISAGLTTTLESDISLGSKTY